MASKMTNAKWGVLIGAGFCLDATEWALDGGVVGVVINPVLDVIVGIGLPLYLKSQGVQLNSKKIITWISAGVLETFLAGAIPLWGVDMVITMLLDKADNVLDVTPKQEEGRVIGHIRRASDKNKLDKAA
jgi:hypothetical protein